MKTKTIKTVINKIFALLLLISITLSIAACSEHKPSGDNNGGNTSDGGDGGADSGGNDSAAGEIFTVTVMLNGKPYEPEASSNPDTAMKARWTDGKSTFTSVVSQDGTATAEGLDGDYTVTLLNLPNGYTYNANIYTATNDKKDITIELIKITSALGDGNDLYRCKSIRKTGTYRATITRADQIIYYEFTPTQAGAYEVESMVDISADMYNPILKVYTGTVAAKFEQDEQDGGGASNTYTKNFLYKINVDKEFLGNTFTFAVRLEGKDAVYPYNVDFSVSYKGTYDAGINHDFTMIIPEYIPSDLNIFDLQMYSSIDESYFTAAELSSDAYKWYLEYLAQIEADRVKYGDNWVDAAERVDGKYVFNEDGYKLNPDDGFYHLYDEEKYASNGGWGPILYADITIPCKFISALNTIEYAGNKTLSVSEGKENYKLFIEGSYELTLSHGDSGPYFCNNTCPCYITYDGARNAFYQALDAYQSAASSGASQSQIKKCVDEVKKCRKNLSSTNGGLCDNSCKSCNRTCYHLPEEVRFQIGYANIAVDGRCPVTEELKVFLQKLSESQRYFSDGNGWIEGMGYTAFEDSQWLFACEYRVK